MRIAVVDGLVLERVGVDAVDDGHRHGGVVPAKVQSVKGQSLTEHTGKS